MEGIARREFPSGAHKTDYKRHVPQENSRKPLTPTYSSKTFVVLVCVTASLLILPLVLPPLQPPPVLLLLVPVAILVMLLILAFTPAYVRGIGSTYL